MRAILLLATNGRLFLRMSAALKVSNLPLETVGLQPKLVQAAFRFVCRIAPSFPKMGTSPTRSDGKGYEVAGMMRRQKEVARTRRKLDRL